METPHWSTGSDAWAPGPPGHGKEPLLAAIGGWAERLRPVLAAGRRPPGLAILGEQSPRTLREAFSAHGPPEGFGGGGCSEFKAPDSPGSDAGRAQSREEPGLRVAGWSVLETQKVKVKGLCQTYRTWADRLPAVTSQHRRPSVGPRCARIWGLALGSGPEPPKAPPPLHPLSPSRRRSG